ncbi:MAG TPA: hypothetical protein DDZ81_23020 [Acetobacteraceae bacterium]|jgi:hypothetical protein|nr:hypothetical protein [Acetobacteraceae bacterium]
MAFINRIDAALPTKLTPMLLCDRLLALADETDRAGFQVVTEHLMYLAFQMVDDQAGLKNNDNR